MNLNLPENADSEQQREILDALPVLIFLERAGRIVYANAQARQMLGLGEGEWVQRPVEDVLWGLFTGTDEPQTLLTGSERSRPFHATLSASNGRLFPVVGTYSILSAELREAVIVAHPEERESAPKAHLMEDVLSSLPEAAAIVYGSHVLYTNPAFERIFGYAAEETIGGNLQEFIVPETRRREFSMLEKTVEQDGYATIETVCKNKKGELLDVALVAGPLLVGGTNAGFVFTCQDIGERKQIEAKLQHDVLHDLLTGLPNRTLFLDRLTLALSRRARLRDQSCGVLFLDLDRFKEINDALGHAAGDALLVVVAERLCAALRPQDTASRLGGDEFAILVENIHSASDLEVVARRVLREMKRPFDIFGYFVRVDVSIGAAMAGKDHVAPELLIRDADFAMYRAKQESGSRFEVFDKNLEVHLTAQIERERELRRVIDKQEFELCYQPIFQLLNGELEGFESGLCWRRPDGSVDDLDSLLPVVEETGLSITMGRETVETVCRQLCDWTAHLPLANLTLTVNLTHRQFYHSDLVEQLKRTLAATGARPEQILFELPERMLSDNMDSAAAILRRMAECNVRLAVDNFGASLAPLNTLLRLPIDVVKLDPELTAAATSTGRPSAVLDAIIHLGRTLGVQVVAQGVQTLEQLDALRRRGCELGQGNLLSPVLELGRAQELARVGHWAILPDACVGRLVPGEG
jgi:diguanylate cyclase (GGDEF)-like protein/PAS domain S-box-containing protein